MKISFHAGAALALLAALAADAPAETRMQVSAGSTSIRTQPAADAPAVGRATAGEVLFVERVEGDWAAVSPPDRIDLWLNKDFIEGNRVVAKSIQLRSGPGVQHPVVGVLERGAPVMPRGEDGDWCRVAAPSSAILWVRKSDLTEVQTRGEPIQQVAPVPEPAKPAPAPKPEPPPPAPPAPKPEPGAQPVDVAAAAPAPAPAPAPTPAPAPQPTPRIAPSQPHATVAPVPKPTAAVPARPATALAQAPVATVTPPPPARPAGAPRPPAAPVLRPATALPAQVPPPAAAKPAPVRRPTPQVAAARVAPTAPTTPAAAQPKPRRTEIEVDPALVDDLDLEDLPNQGKTVQVEGELRNAPFMAGSPSRYRLQARDENGVLEMICHVHGDSAQLRPFVGRTIAIRGREYWVADSDMPVVVVGQVEPLVPVAAEDEPVMF